MSECSDAKIELAYVTIAAIVKNHGTKYLPIFRRLHDERELRKANNDLLSIAHKVAMSKNEQAY